MEFTKTIKNRIKVIERYALEIQECILISKKEYYGLVSEGSVVYDGDKRLINGVEIVIEEGKNEQ